MSCGATWIDSSAFAAYPHLHQRHVHYPEMLGSIQPAVLHCTVASACTDTTSRVSHTDDKKTTPASPTKPRISSRSCDRFAAHFPSTTTHHTRTRPTMRSGMAKLPLPRHTGHPTRISLVGIAGRAGRQAHVSLFQGIQHPHAATRSSAECATPFHFTLR